MPGNSFGQLFRITTFGESHGHSIGVILDGCPAGLKIEIEEIQRDLARRRPGQSAIVTQRDEPDHVEILSGVFEGIATGTPIALTIRNKDQKSKDYSHIADRYRPSHADYTYQQKYGHRDYRGGGRSSARETAARVAAAAIAKAFLRTHGISLYAYVSQVGELVMDRPYQEVDPTEIEKNIVRCPDAVMAEKMIDYIKSIRKEGDTVGGVITGVIKGCPVGLGEPAFDKLHADLGKAMLSINACKGFEYGSGFGGVSMRGSQHNDQFVTEGDQIVTRTNYSGGVQGGISNGMDIYFKVAFKPVATIMRDQNSIDREGREATVKGKGRHDPCVVPRAVPIVEAMTALVLADHLLRSRAVRV
ncbi:MAG: chorismate synthase [Saprospiraceae bacterium]|nr:chorismate synthase [Saprospiraceae bacterium]